MARPNILFFFPDQHRREWMPYSGEIFARWGMQKPELQMPNLAGLMARGTTFLRVSTPSPLCAPARACIASGTQYPRCETPGNDCDYPLSKPTMYQALRAEGYHVLGVGKFDLRKRTCDWFNTAHARTLGFTDYIDSEGKWDAVIHYNRHGVPRGPYMKFLQEHGYDKVHLDDFDGRKRQTYRTPLPDELYCDNWIAGNAMEKIAAVPEGDPWFIQVNFTGPHDPFDITERMFETVKDRKFELGHGDVPLENANEIRQCYAAMIENIDCNIGEILAAVAARGELDNTIIIYASDHGEMLGDHAKYAKCVPERGSLNVPCVIAVPEAIRNNWHSFEHYSGKRDYKNSSDANHKHSANNRNDVSPQGNGVYTDAIVELQDLTNTMLEFAGATLPSAVNSQSLLPLLRGETTTHRDFSFSALDTMPNYLGFASVADIAYKYVAFADGSEALFDLAADVWEDHNIAPQHPEITVLYREKVECVRNN